MKFSLALIATFAPLAMAGPMDTCAAQENCMDFTITKVEAGDCGGDCYYNICQTFTLGGSCTKSRADTISHICKKDDDSCPLSPGFADSTSQGNVEDGETVCQQVPVGGVAEFLVKDGNAKGGCGTGTINFLGGSTAQCSTATERDGSCSGKGNLGKECVWRVPAPASCGSGGGVGGDPHIKLWNGTRYSFHGECDLMMLHSDEFAGKTGLDLHIRSTIVDFYSYIETAALRIGSSVLEVTSGHFYVNGEERFDEDLPLTIEGYTLNEPEQMGNAKVYRVDLENDDFINFRTYKHFLSVDVAGNKKDFGKSKGLLGNFNNGAMVGRRGQTIEQTIDFGMEWQLTEDEPKLFRETRGPQLPHAKCVMPTATSRHLRQMSDPMFLASAERACAHKPSNDFEFCVFDILATRDLGMAHAW